MRWGASTGRLTATTGSGGCAASFRLRFSP